MEIAVNPSITYTSDGETLSYSFNFDYLRKAYVYVKVDDEDVDNFSIAGKVITFAAAPEEDAIIRIYRDTPTTRLVSWADASVLKAKDMTVQQVQLLHILEEAQYWIKTYTLILDNNATGQGITIPHGKAKGFEWNEDGTAIVLVEQPSAIKYQCEQLAAQAKEYRDLCLTYKNNASTSEANALSYKNSADSYSQLSKAWAESANSPDGVVGSKSSKTWASYAESQALEAGRQAQYCTAMAAEGSVYDSTNTYEAGETAMTPEGTIWRCITESTGEDPSTSSKWVMVSLVVNDTFELDENGDLMPLMYPKNSSQFEVDSSGDIMPAL